MDGPLGARGLEDPLVAVDALNRHRSHPQHQGEYSYEPPAPPYLSGDTSTSGPPLATLTEGASYKELKEAWIADQTGSSIHLVNTLGLVMLLTYAIWAVLRAKRIRFVRAEHRIQPQALGHPGLSASFSALAKLSDWQLEFLILIVPAVSAHTVLASHLVLTNAALSALLLLLVRGGPPLLQNPGPLYAQKQERHWSKKYSDDEEIDVPGERVGSSLQTNMSRLKPNAPATEPELPFRVSIDSAADAAHAAAAPPNFYDGPSSYNSSFGSNADFSVDAPSSATSQSPTLGLASSVFPGRGTEGTLLSPDLAMASAFPSPARRSVEFAALQHTPMQPLHSRDNSDAQSVISASSAMSPLARSVVAPWARGKRSSFDHSTSASEEPSSPQEPSTAASIAATSPFHAAQQSDHNMFVRPQPFLTVYRAHMMLVTIVSILAVDFPVFPRALSKCESWGTSWMDMGVGSFVFSLGIISALPFLKSPRNRFRSLRQQIVSDFKKSLPLLLLGSVRVIMVKGVEYPEHVSEYGVHWNFFITLALLPFAATLSRPFSKYIRYSVLGLVLTCVHQVLLKSTHWEDWALSSEVARDTLLRQNKEGITSMVGYLAIFFIGLDLGHYVLPLDPYFAYRKLRRRRSQPRTDKLAMVLASLAVLWWVGFATSYLVGLRTSRRLANLPYVLWVSAFNTSFLLCYVLIYLVVLQPVEQARPSGSRDQGDSVTPAILEDLNRHSLTVFLVANLLTGLVNVTTQTMYTRDSLALLILLLYTGTCCALATTLTAKGIRLRL